MPELPDIELYLACLRSRIFGRRFLALRIYSPFVLRTVTPPVAEVTERNVVALKRIGKRVAIGLEDDFWMVIHLMVAGRFQWLEKPVRPNRMIHADFEFDSGTLRLSEASTKKRASLHLFPDSKGLAECDPGGAEPLDPPLPFERFSKLLLQENRTLKRALTNPAKFSGIGNAFSDEILHSARVSPIKLTQSLSTEELARVHSSVISVLSMWRNRLIEEHDGGRMFPKQGTVTAFRPDFAVHGKYGKPCPACGAPVQRIVYAENETNYCAVCQNQGVVLADRALSRLLKTDWPRTLEGFE